MLQNRGGFCSLSAAPRWNEQVRRFRQSLRLEAEAQALYMEVYLPTTISGFVSRPLILDMVWLLTSGEPVSTMISTAPLSECQTGEPLHYDGLALMVESPGQVQRLQGGKITIVHRLR